MGDHRIGKADRRVYRIAGIQPLGRRANFQGRRSTDTAVAAPRAHVQRAATDRRCWRLEWHERRRRPGEPWEFRVPTAADRFDARFAVELRRRVEALPRAFRPEMIRLSEHVAVDMNLLFATLLRAPERGAP
jgi:hypothetical protein